MKINKKVTLLGLAGFSIVSGTVYYFYKKRQALQIDPISGAQQIIHEIFEKRLTAKQLENKLQQLNKIIQYFIINSQNALKEEVKNEFQEPISHRLCSQASDTFYECEDCSNYSSFPSEIQRIRDTSNINAFCNNCFDYEKHKGHKVSQRTLNQASCTCGSSYHLKEQGFCDNHKGFRDIKSSFDNTFPKITKDQIISFFKSLISTLIDLYADFHYEQTKNQQKNKVYTNNDTRQLFTSKQQQKQQYINKESLYDILMAQIISQINLLIDSNNQYIYCFVELFQIPLCKPTRIDTKQVNKDDLLHQKVLDAEQTLFEYLQRMSIYLTYDNLNQYSLLIKKLVYSDENFHNFITEKYLNLLYYSIYVRITKQNEEDVAVLTLSPISKICESTLTNQKFWQNIQMNKNYLLINLLEQLNRISEKLNLYLYNEDTFNLFIICSQFCMNLKNQLNNIERVEQLAINLIQIFSNISQLSALKTKTLELEQLCQIVIYSNNSINALTILLFHFLQELINKIVLEWEESELDKFRQAFSQEYCRQIELQFYLFQKSEMEQNSCITYFSLSVAIFIIPILYLYKIKKINSITIMEVLKKAFNHYNQDKFDQLIKKISYILQSWNILDSYTENSLTLLQVQAFAQQLPDIQQQLQLLLFMLKESKVPIYDYQILSLQVINLISKKEDNTCLMYVKRHKIAKQEELNENPMIFYIYLKRFLAMNQIMFDQTPYLNTFYYLYDEEQQFDDKVNKVMKEIILNLLEWFPNIKNDFNVLQNCVLSTVNNRILFEKYIYQYGHINNSNNAFITNPIEKTHLSKLNMGRYYVNLFDSEIKDSLNDYYYESDTFNSFFDFHKELFLKTYSNKDILIYILEVLNNEENKADQIHFFIDILSIINELIVYSIKSPTIFTQEQLEDVIEMKQLLFDQNKKNIILQPLKQYIEQNNFEDNSRQNNFTKVHSFYSQQEVL